MERIKNTRILQIITNYNSTKFIKIIILGLIVAVLEIAGIGLIIPLILILLDTKKEYYLFGYNFIEKIGQKYGGVPKDVEFDAGTLIDQMLYVTGDYDGKIKLPSTMTEKEREELKFDYTFNILPIEQKNSSIKLLKNLRCC